MKKLYIIVLLLTASNVSGRVLTPTLNKLVQIADWIGLVEIIDLDTLMQKKIVAKAKVEKIYKGKEIKVIEFWAHKSWMCDITAAQLGEKSFVFLNGARKGKNVTWAGRGKFNIINIGELEKNELHPYILFPYDLIEIADTDTIEEIWGINIKRYVNKNTLEKSILTLIDKPGQYLWDYFNPPDMYMCDKHVLNNKNLTKDEIKTIFNGEINKGTTTRILNLMLGSPSHIASDSTYIWWRYRVNKKDIKFRIDSNNFVSIHELPGNLKWKKIE